MWNLLFRDRYVPCPTLLFKIQGNGVLEGGGGAVLSFYTKTRSSVFVDDFVSDKLAVSFRQNIFNQPVIQLIVQCSVDIRVTLCVA